MKLYFLYFEKDTYKLRRGPIGPAPEKDDTFCLRQLCQFCYLIKKCVLLMFKIAIPHSAVTYSNYKLGYFHVNLLFSDHGIDGQVTFYQHTCHNRPHPLSTVHPLKGNPNVRCGSGTEISSIPWRGSTVNMFVGFFTSDGCFGSENKPGPGGTYYCC